MKHKYLALASLPLVIASQGAFAAPEPEGPSYEELLERVESLESDRISSIAMGHTSAKDAKEPIAPISFPEADDSGYYLELEAVLAKPFFSRDSAYGAQVGDDVVQNVDFDYDFEISPRIEFGYLAPTSQLGWRARFWHYEADASAPDHDPEDDAIAIVAGGSGIEDIDALTAVHHDFELDILDLELTSQLPVGLLSYGLRAQRMDQEFSFESDDGDLSSEMETVLVGPTAALEMSRDLQNSDFSLYGNARASVLFGTREIDTLSDDGDYSSDDDIVVFNGVLGAGVIWEPEDFYSLDGFYMNLGVEASWWSGVGALMNNNTAQEDDLDDFLGGSAETDADVGTLGIVLGAGWKF